MYYSVVLGRPYIKRFALCYRTVVMSVLSCLSTWMDQDATEVGLGASDIVLMGTHPLPKKWHSPQFSPMSIVTKHLDAWMDQDATWYGRRPRPRPHCARWGPSSPPKKVAQPLIFAHACCGQTAGWTKMPLGTEETLVRLGTSFPPQKEGTAPTIFGPCLLWPNG